MPPAHFSIVILQRGTMRQFMPVVVPVIGLPMPMVVFIGPFVVIGLIIAVTMFDSPVASFSWPSCYPSFGEDRSAEGVEVIFSSMLTAPEMVSIATRLL